MRKVSLATTQMACVDDKGTNIELAEQLVRDAAARGAQIILLQELFEKPYFCKDMKDDFFAFAHAGVDNPLVARFQAVARELSVVLPVSFYERANNAYFNSIAIVDADGSVLGVYRKSHIPHGPGYQEKYYFSPGDTGFKVWDTAYARIGVAICWDQWFPESARIMSLMGAEVLMYPTAIGSEPDAPDLDSSGHWQRTMQGHSAANCVPVVASNRIGTEKGSSCDLTFYGSSFITDQTGDKVVEGDRQTQDVLVADFDLDAVQDYRTSWGLFRDRRPDLYGGILNLDGNDADSMSKEALPTAASDGFRMPPEWAPHERTWMAWPYRRALWGEKLPAMQSSYADVINAIAAFEPVSVLAAPSEVEHCRSKVSDNVTVLAADLNDAWMRDIGPNFVLNDDGNLAASIYHFNAWGGKYEQWGKDAAVGHRIAEHLGIRTFSSTIYMEGGGINVDGEGTLLTAEQCVLNPNRNPGLSKEDAELAFHESLGVDKTLWCPGDPDDIETDGHIDGIACFIEPGKVLVEICPEKGTERYDNLQINLQCFQGATDASGRALDVITIEEAYEADRTSEIYASSYINFYIANNAVIMPAFGIDRDQDARDTIASLFPDREVVQVDVRGIAPGGGGIHCITQQQPVSNLTD